MFEVIINGYWDPTNGDKIVFSWFEANEWLIENKIQYKEWEENLTEIYHYIFKCEEDAMAFKLRFS